MAISLNFNKTGLNALATDPPKHGVCMSEFD